MVRRSGIERFRVWYGECAAFILGLVCVCDHVLFGAEKSGVLLYLVSRVGGLGGELPKLWLQCERDMQINIYFERRETVCINQG